MGVPPAAAQREAGLAAPACSLGNKHRQTARAVRTLYASQVLVCGFIAGNAQDLPPASCLILPTEGESQAGARLLSWAVGHSPVLRPPGNPACIFCAVVTVTSATPNKNQEDIAQFSPSVSGPDSSLSPSSVTASATAIKWHLILKGLRWHET